MFLMDSTNKQMKKKNTYVLHVLCSGWVSFLVRANNSAILSSRSARNQLLIVYRRKNTNLLLFVLCALDTWHTHTAKCWTQHTHIHTSKKYFYVCDDLISIFRYICTFCSGLIFFLWAQVITLKLMERRKKYYYFVAVFNFNFVIKFIYLLLYIQIYNIIKLIIELILRQAKTHTHFIFSYVGVVFFWFLSTL